MEADTLFLNSRKYGQSRRAARWFAPSIVVALLLLAPSLHAQFKGQRGAIRAGNGLFETRDSVLTFLLDTTRFAGSGTDTVSYVARLGNWAFGDSSGSVFFNEILGSSPGAYRFYSLGQAVSDIVLDAVYIAHEYDSSGVFYAQRDTAILSPGSVATIPRGSYIFACYSGAATYSAAPVVPQDADKAAQQVALFYVLGGNSAGTIVRACSGIQVPLILGAGWKYGLGVRSATGLDANLHYVTVTSKFHTKRP